MIGDALLTRVKLHILFKLDMFYVDFLADELQEVLHLVLELIDWTNQPYSHDRVLNVDFTFLPEEAGSLNYRYHSLGLGLQLFIDTSRNSLRNAQEMNRLGVQGALFESSL